MRFGGVIECRRIGETGAMSSRSSPAQPAITGQARVRSCFAGMQSVGSVQAQQLINQLFNSRVGFNDVDPGIHRHDAFIHVAFEHARP